MGRIRERGAAGIVIGQDGGQNIGLRGPHAVEQCEISIAVPEEAQHRHHAIDGIEQRQRRRDVARGERGAQRQEIDQQFDERARIAADMAAVGENLPGQLFRQPLGGGADVTLLARHAQRGVGERDGGLQTRHAVACMRHRTPEVADLPGQAAQKAAIELHVGIIEQQWRLAQPGDHASGDNVGSPGDGVAGIVEGDPFVDQRAGIGAGDAGLSGAQMAQPAEAQQRDRPILGWRSDLKRRAGVAEDNLAGEGEPASIDLGRPRRVGRAQVLRRDDDAVGLPEGKRPIDDRMRRYAAGELAYKSARQEHG